jgi:hypothetical protein
MGYYWHYIEDRWVEIDHGRKITRAEQQRTELRRFLVEDLITELKDGADSVAALYAGLLARALVSSDRFLMKDYGETVVRLTEPQIVQKQKEKN